MAFVPGTATITEGVNETADNGVKPAWPFRTAAGGARWAFRLELAAMKARLDQVLVDRKLVPTRSRARDLVVRGCVRVDGACVLKPAHHVARDSRIEIDAGEVGLVSRGGHKLAAALDQFALDPKDRVALDLGASTGGFAQVLLARGARHVFAVDVGHGQLAAVVADDERVTCLEGLDARDITATQITVTPDAIVVDLSFISTTKALAPALAMAGAGAWLVVLVKPQFELTPADIGKGGIVRDEAARLRALDNVKSWIAGQPHWRVLGTMPSPIAGGSGNIEYLIGAVRD